jgi:hypothetical protein
MSESARIGGNATPSLETNQKMIMNVQEMSEMRELTADELDSVTAGFWAWLEVPVLALAVVVALGAGLVAMADSESWLAAPVWFEALKHAAVHPDARMV